jgi:hypothetical protein
MTRSGGAEVTDALWEAGRMTRSDEDPIISHTQSTGQNPVLIFY